MRRNTPLIALLASVWIFCGNAQELNRAQISAEASGHLTEIVTILQTQWYQRRIMDWGAFRGRVLERAGAAQTIPDTYDAIRLALTLLGDRHSYYVTAEGESIYNPESPSQSTGECTPPPPVTPQIPADVGYIRIQFSAMKTVAESIQGQIQLADKSSLRGWIVDMRNSRGGNMWPVLAGLGPLLGEGRAGLFVDADGKSVPWGYASGRAWLGEMTMVQLAKPYALIRKNPRIALLMDIGVVSSGEALAVAFRVRPKTRSFGTPTCGLSTGVSQVPLSRGGRIAVVTTVMADRAATRYGSGVKPDELVREPTQVVAHAVAWLRRR